MPQLDPTSFPSQLFWLTLTFVGLYVLMSRFLLPRIQQVLDAREGKLSGDLLQADTLKNEAESAKASYEKALADARNRSQAMISETLEAMKTQAEKRQREQEAALRAQIGKAESSIAEAKQTALAGMAPIASELASLIVETLLHTKPDAQQVGRRVGGLSRQK